MEVIATDPAPGAHVPPGTTVTASVRLEPGAAPGDLAVALDGADVTARCALRTDLAHPPRRADLVFAGPLDDGEHEIVVSLGSAHGSHAWRFTVGESDQGPSPEAGEAMTSPKEGDG